MVNEGKLTRTRAFSWAVSLLFLTSNILASQGSSTRIQKLLSQAQTDERQGHIDDAIKNYDTILAINPNFAAAYEHRGKLEFQQSRYPDTIKSLQRALQINPHLALSQALLGISFYKIGNFQAARRELESVQRQNPKNKEIRIYLARTLVEVGEPEQAERQFQELRREDPRNAEVLYALGQLYMKLAAATFDDLQQRAPDSYLIEMLLGDIAETRGLYPEAIEHYRKAIAKKGADARGLHYPLGHALYNDGAFQEAVQEFRRELALNPYDYMASTEASEILLRDNPKEALRFANQALETKPNHAPALFVRGRALLIMGKTKQAAEDLKKAASLSPKDPLIHFQLARAYRQLGLTSEARNEDALYRQLQHARHTPKPEKPQ